MSIKNFTVEILVLLFAAFTVSGTELILADQGKTDYVIVAASAGTKLNRLAVKEFSAFFEESTGARPEVIPAESTDWKKYPKRIFIGNFPVVRELLGPEKIDSLSKDESMIVTGNNDLFLFGGGRFGTIYAVYAFLENQLGCRWYSITGDEKIPKYERFSISSLNYGEKPHFAYRMLLCAEYHKHPAAKMFFFRNRMNMIWGDYGNAGLQVRKTVDTPMCHTLFYYIPPHRGRNPYQWKWNEDKEYFKSNPEFFSMDQDGKRVDHLQLCFSNPALRAEFTKRISERIERTGKNIYTISAMDWPGIFCCCPECRKLEKQYNCTAGPMLDYLIELCNMLEKKYPEVMILTAAYRKTQSEIPPDINGKLPDNLIIGVAPIDDDCSKDYEHKNNAGTYRNIQKWNQLASNVWVWYYPCFGGSPSADFERTAQDTKLLAEAGCNGVYYEHDIEVFQGMGFSDMMTWLLLKLYQKPDVDWRVLVREFSDTWYGKASHLMLDYLYELQELRTECRDFIRWDFDLTLHYTPEQLLKWEKLFDRMELECGSDLTTLNHVREARMPLDLLMLSRWHDFADLTPPGSPAVLKERILRTLDTSLKRRYPDNENARKIWRKGIVDKTDKSYMMASFTPKPLPAPLDQIPNSKVRQTIPVNTPYAEVTEMADAAYGVAMREPNKPLELPFTFGLYDFYNKKMVIRKSLKKEELKIDRFHLYHLGTVTISQNCRLWLTGSWSAHVALESFHTPGFPDKKWELYVSLKFEGPDYNKKSKAKKNNVWMDRVVLVEK